MSHFTVGIILTEQVNDEVAINHLVERAMSPYDENLEVAPYKEKCSCIGRTAKTFAADYACNRLGIPREMQNRELRIAWHETWSIEAMQHPDYDKPLPYCEDCHGAGLRDTTYNPNSKWDWYRIGGRWDGAIKNNRQFSENGFNFDSQHETINNNMAHLGELSKQSPLFIPFALITPDGKWHERGRMGRFATVDGEALPGEWEKQCAAIYQQYGNHKMVLIDAHI